MALPMHVSPKPTSDVPSPGVYHITDKTVRLLTGVSLNTKI